MLTIWVRRVCASDLAHNDLGPRGWRVRDWKILRAGYGSLRSDSTGSRPASPAHDVVRMPRRFRRQAGCSALLTDMA